MTEHDSGPTVAGIPTGAATTGGFRQLGDFADVILSSPGPVMRIPDQRAARYLHLLFALREERLWTIASFFPAIALFAMRDMRERAESLLRDIADGTISRSVDLPAPVRAELQERIRADRPRARELQSLIDRERFTVADIWPDMGAMLTVTGGAFRFYVDQLRPFLGDLRLFSPAYIASEGVFGFGFAPDLPQYLLLPTLAYIEFLPMDVVDDSDARPIPAWRAKVGECYEVVVTTWGGLVRYRMHDIVRVVDIYNETPVIEFIERRGQIVDIAGEKTAEHHVVDAIDRACHEWDEPLVDYVLGPDTAQSPASYMLAIEEWHTDSDDNLRAREFVGAVDDALQEIAPDYGEERELGTLGPMRLVLLKTGAFERLRARAVASGRPASQIKTPHVVPDPGYIAREFADDILMRE
jgi:hypothetical protein